jgi:hypothetical protein
MTIFDITYSDDIIYFITDPNDDSYGISIDWENNWITYETIIENDVMFHIYNFKPADVNVTIRLNAHNHRDAIIDMGVKTFGLTDTISLGLVENFQRFLKDRLVKQAKQAGRELAMVKQLPTLDNTRSVIGSFISGAPGSLNMQRFRLRRNAGNVEGPIRPTRSEVRRQGGRRAASRGSTRRVAKDLRK